MVCNIRRGIAFAAATLVLLLLVAPSSAAPLPRNQVKLIAIAGQLGTSEDSALFEIDVSDASPTFIKQLINGPDTNSIAWNPIDGHLYYTSGSDSWTNDPFREAGGTGFRDNQYMEKVPYTDTDDPGEVIYNANPPNADPANEPIDSYFNTYHKPGPRPGWAYPSIDANLPRRSGVGLVAPTDNDGDPLNPADFPGGVVPNWIDNHWRQTQCTNGLCGRGPNEMHGFRNETQFHRGQRQWYATDEFGLFTLTPDGEPTRVGQPVDDPNFPGNQARSLKGIVIYHAGPGQTKYLTGFNEENNLWEINPATGALIGNPTLVTIVDENGTFIKNSDGLIAMAQHPVTGVVYALNRTPEDARELLILDPATGNAEIIGAIQTSDGAGIAAFTFAGWILGDMDHDGDLDFDDIDDLVLGLNNPAGYAAIHGVPAAFTGDQDEDADLDFDDINGFVDLLSGGGQTAAIPEPSSIVLAALALLGLTGYRLRRRT